MNIIVYKEVTQALTRKYLTPTLPDYLHSLLPASTDRFTSMLSRLGLAATFASLEELESQNPLIAPPVTVCSAHTKHALEVMPRPDCFSRSIVDLSSISTQTFASFVIRTISRTPKSCSPLSCRPFRTSP